MANSIEYYRKLMGTEIFNDEKERIYSESKNLYNKEVQSFLDKETVDIDNFTDKYENITVLIKKHSNPLNSDKEDRKIYIPSDVSFHRGSVITWYNNYWIIINDIDKEDQNGMSVKGNMQKCNNTLKWIDSKGITQEIPCIIENKTLYSDGLNSGNEVTTLDTMKTLVISNNNLTKDLKEGQRLLFNHNKRYCYEISEINELVIPGLLRITLITSAYNSSTDDLENNLCDINKLASYSLQMLSTNPLSVSVGKTLSLQVELRNNGVLVTDTSILSQITYSSDNTDVVTVDSNGLISGVGTGSCNITASLVNNPDIKVVIGIESVNEVIEPIITYDIVSSTGNYFIKKTSTVTFNPIKYQDQVAISNVLFDFDIVSYNGLSTSSVSIVATTDNYIKIKNNVDSGSFVLRTFERGTSNYIEKTIQLKNIYGN